MYNEISTYGIQKYLDYIKNKYSEFRYLSDKNILDNLKYFKNINYKIISNKIWFCIVYTDSRISKDTCFFWFFEIYNKTKTKEFFDEIKKIVKNNLSIEGFNHLKTLVWPINFSVWNTYRFWNLDNNNDEVILWEYEVNNSFNKLFLDNNFNIYEKYITAKRNWKNPYILNSKFIDYEIKKVNINKETLKIIYDLSVLIFIKAPKIEFEEFGKYMQVYFDLYKNNIWEFLLNYNWENIWFLSSFYNEQYFVIKTVWILKEYRWKWLWNYFLQYVYEYYLNKGLDKSYYLYMRDKWDALNMTDKNANIYREYFTYYIKL